MVAQAALVLLVWLWPHRTLLDCKNNVKPLLLQMLVLVCKLTKLLLLNNLLLWGKVALALQTKLLRWARATHRDLRPEHFFLKAPPTRQQ